MKLSGFLVKSSWEGAGGGRSTEEGEEGEREEEDRRD